MDPLLEFLEALADIKPEHREAETDVMNWDLLEIITETFRRAA